MLSQPLRAASTAVRQVRTSALNLSSPKTDRSARALSLSRASAPAFPLPSDANAANVRDFGAIGDGVADDTAAIQSALDANRFVYLPSGTYLVSDTLLTSSKRALLQGESEANTVIRLKDGVRLFDDPAEPKPVLSTFEGSGSTGQAFQNFFQNFTVEVGANNPGAIGIRFTNNNQGGLRNVTIRSLDPLEQGSIGLALTKAFPGPALVKHVTIDGFNYGIRVRHPEFSNVFEHIALQNQRVAGIENAANILSIRGLTSQNSVPAIQNIADPRSVVVVLDSNLSGGSATRSAIENWAGTLYARNVTTTGYQSAIQTGSAIVPGNTVTEYTSGRRFSLWGSPQTSLNLPIQETPEVSYGDRADWVSVTQYGANGQDLRDDTAAIQRALNSGQPTVYFPRGTYVISNTLRVGSQVKAITGFYSTLRIADPLRNRASAVFRFEHGSQNTVLLERFWGDYNSGRVHWVEHAAAGTLVLKNFAVGSGRAYRNTGFGPLFIEDVTAGDWVFDRQQVWARQLNPENSGTKVVNRGGSLWLFGLKTENEGTVVDTHSGGKTEIFGGLIYPAVGSRSLRQAAFMSTDAHLSIAGVGESRYTSGTYRIVIQETRNGIVRTLVPSQLPRRNNGFLVPLYAGLPVS